MRKNCGSGIVMVLADMTVVVYASCSGCGDVVVVTGGGNDSEGNGGDGGGEC